MYDIQLYFYQGPEPSCLNSRMDETSCFANNSDEQSVSMFHFRIHNDS